MGCKLKNRLPPARSRRKTAQSRYRRAWRAARAAAPRPGGRVSIHIYYGPPATGKSHTAGKDEGAKVIEGMPWQRRGPAQYVETLRSTGPYACYTPDGRHSNASDEDRRFIIVDNTDPDTWWPNAPDRWKFFRCVDYVRHFP